MHSKSIIKELTACTTRGGLRGLEGNEKEEVVENARELGLHPHATCDASVSHAHTQSRQYERNLHAGWDGHLPDGHWRVDATGFRAPATSMSPEI